MEYDQRIEELWYLLLTFDKTWFMLDDNEEYILINSAGQEIHSNTLEGVLQGALSLAGQRIGRTGI